jgi:rhodanese-related sulfurtransferase
MNIPGSRCCPNGELVYRVKEIVPRPETKIIINCAGRTRSIIGAQTLINFGIPNPVYALENGTLGWYLEDLQLEHGAQRSHPPVSGNTDIVALRAGAEALASKHGVRFIDASEANHWLRDSSRTTYLCDVRTQEEFTAGTVPGAVHTAGGQLIQATDKWIAVRNARIVLIDHEGVRAPVTASWLRQMGHDAYVLREGASASVQRTWSHTVNLPEVGTLSVAELEAMLASRSCTVVDLRGSMAYRKAHIAGSTWCTRSGLNHLECKVRGRVVLIADDADVARVVAHDLARAGITQSVMLAGGLRAWHASGLPTEATPDVPPDSDCIDYLFFVHDRHVGNKEAARQYLAWETNLVNIIDHCELSSFRPGTPDTVA